MKELASKFLEPQIIRKLKDENLSLAKLDISLENQKDDKNLTIVNIIKPKLCKVLDEGDISQSGVDKFYEAVREFFKTAYTYCIKQLPLSNPLYKVSRYIKYSNQEKLSFDDLTKLLSFFPRQFENCIQDPYQLDSFKEEYHIYQSMSDLGIPEENQEKSLVNVSEERIYHCMDIAWGHLRTCKNWQILHSFC